MTEDEMAGWHHRLNGHEVEQALGVGDGQGSLECCSPWGCKESDLTWRLNNNSVPNTGLCPHGSLWFREGERRSSSDHKKKEEYFT